MPTEIQDKIIIQTSAELEPLMPGFLENRQRNVVTLTLALAKDDFETIGRIGHSMRGVGTGYGFDYISEIGWQLEEAATARQTTAIDEFIRALTTYLSRVEIFYIEEE